MLRSRYFIILLLFPICVTSCRPTRPTLKPAGSEPDAAAYIAKYKDLAISEMKRTGIPASITLAQGMIESDFGQSTLAREGNNHFGIKCHDDWRGPTIRHHDDRRNECFRKYSRPEDSFYDHSDFLRSGSRYSSLFELYQTDYKGWAKGLKKAGYATNPDYANMLIRKIEENNLFYYDRDLPLSEHPENHRGRPETEIAKPVNDSIAPEEPAVRNKITGTVPNLRIMENNRIQYIIVKDGETREMIEKEFQLMKWELARYNELDDDFIPITGQKLYLQPKRDKAEPGKAIHIISEGDTMYSISQHYGIKVKKLYEMNRMMEGEEPVPGGNIWLRTMKPVN